MNTYEKKQEKRREYYEEKARQAREAAEKSAKKSTDMMDVIPFGQPIMGARDRRYRERAGNYMDKAVEGYKKADYYEQKAAAVGKGGISSDDPDAIKKLTAQLEERRKNQELMKAANRAVRLKDTEKGNAKLKELGLSDKDIETLRKPNLYGEIGYPSYSLSLNNASIHRIERRIKELQARALEEQNTESEENELYTFALEENRYQFIFDGKPSEEIRAVLKRHGFRWSPRRGAWVRQATLNGKYAADSVKEELGKLV